MSETQHYAGRYMTAEDIRGLADLQDQYGIAMGRMIDAEKEVARLTAENARLAAAEAALRAALVGELDEHAAACYGCMNQERIDALLARPASERGQAIIEALRWYADPKNHDRGHSMIPSPTNAMGRQG